MQPTAKAAPGSTWPSSAGTEAKWTCAPTCWPGEPCRIRCARRTGSSTSAVSKGLEFQVVTMVGVGHMPAEGEDEREEARLFYEGTTRSTQRLVIGASGDGCFGRVVT